MWHRSAWTLYAQNLLSQKTLSTQLFLQIEQFNTFFELGKWNVSTWGRCVLFQVRNGESKIDLWSQFWPKIHFLLFGNIAEIWMHFQNSSFYVPLSVDVFFFKTLFCFFHQIRVRRENSVLMSVACWFRVRKEAKSIIMK